MALFGTGDNNFARYKLTTGALLTDTGGDANGLTLTNTGSVGNTTGWQGSANTAASFNGTNQWLSRANNAVMNVNNVSFSGRIKLLAIPSVQGFIFSQTDGGTGLGGVDASTVGRSYELAVNNAGLLDFTVSHDGNNTPYCLSDITLSVGTWYHVVCTYDGTTAKIYINNAVHATSTAISGNLYHSPGGLFIGTRAIPDQQSTYPLNAVIDDIAFWGRALSSTEVDSLYNGYNENFVIPPITGTIGIAADGITVAATAKTPNFGFASFTLAGATVAIDASNNVPIASIATLLGGVTVDVTALLRNTAAIPMQLEGIIPHFAAFVPIAGIAYVTLDNLTTAIFGNSGVTQEAFSVKVRHKTSGVAQIGLSNVFMTARQQHTGYRYDFNDSTFKASPTLANSKIQLLEVDNTNQPGLYERLVTTTLWDDWIDIEVTYDDGSFTYAWQDSAFYKAGVRVNGITTFSGDVIAPSASQVASAVWARQIEGVLTAEQLHRLFTSILTGLASGAGTGTEVFMSNDNSKPRVTFTTDTHGNRTGVTIDAA